MRDSNVEDADNDTWDEELDEETNEGMYNMLLFRSPIL